MRKQRVKKGCALCPRIFVIIICGKGNAEARYLFMFYTKNQKHLLDYARKKRNDILLLYSTIAPGRLVLYLQIQVANVQLSFIVSVPFVFGIAIDAFLVSGTNATTFFPLYPATCNID